MRPVIISKEINNISITFTDNTASKIDVIVFDFVFLGSVYASHLFGLQPTLD
jgi:hypothetical protein